MESNSSMGFDLSAAAAVFLFLVSSGLFFLLMYLYYSCHRGEKRRRTARSGPPELPVVTYRRRGEGDRGADGCAVCLGEFEEGEELRAVPGCGHAFHPGCIDRWIAAGRRSCPVCRRSVLSESKNAVAVVSAPVAAEEEERAVEVVVQVEDG